MKPILLLLLLSLILSCKSEQERNIEKLDKAIRERIENEAFRENKPVKLLEISSVSYEIVGQGALDSARRYSYIKKQDEFLELGERYIKLSSDETPLINLSRDAGMASLAEQHSKDAKDYLDLAQSYQDSVTHYANLDSLLALKMKDRKQDTGTYFNAKCFCKATVGNENYLDTLRFVFDKDFRYVK